MRLLKKCLCLILVLACMVSATIIAPAHVHAASASDYISSTWASSISVKTTATAGLASLPTKNTGASYTVASGTMLRVTALHKNTSGEYWYQVSYYGETLYVDATATTMVSHLTGDVEGTDMFSPSNIAYGAGFPIGGNITAVNNDLGKITASMYSGTDLSRYPALTSSDNASGKSYNLTNSTVDVGLHFNKLSAGSYTYLVTAEAVSYYIDDNDAFATAKTTVIIDQQICAVTSSSGNPVLNNGIDVSVWNGSINWASVKSQVDFVIIRASWEYTADENFATNASGCQSNGIPFGVYVYSYAETVEEGIREAEAVLSIVDGYDLDLPIFFDWEDEICVNLSYDTQRSIVRAFCDTIYDAGYQPGLYTYIWLMNSVFTENYYKTLPIWVAEIRSSGSSYTSYTGPIWMWQWSWVGHFNGMSGDVDCNRLYVDLPGGTASASTNLTKCDYYPTNMLGTTKITYNMREYPSTDYNIITSVAQGSEVHITGLYRNTYGNLWYQIEYDGRTGYIGAESIEIKEYLYNDISVKNPAMADNLDVGKGYYIQGDLSSVYNELTKVSTKIYSGEDTTATPVLNSTVAVGEKEYSLYKSDVDYGLYFSNLSEGYYTYEISADVTMYYYDNGNLASTTKNVVLWSKPFTVGNAAIEAPGDVVCNHSIVTDPGVPAGCTTKGFSPGAHCSKCQLVITAQTEIPATGHNYQGTYIPATCIDYGKTIYKCTGCGDSYTQSDSVGYSEWFNEKPDVDESRIETKTQYRYSEYEQVKNYQPSMDGYGLFSMEWESQGQKSQECVKSWPAGFDTSNSFYTKYNLTPKTNSTDTYYNKTEVNSEVIVGYVYYHWCAGRVIGDGPYNSFTSMTKTDKYSAFHAFYSTENPADKTTASDSSVTYPNASCCTDSWWYYNVPVYKQTYTDYKALYTHSRWAPWSEWSDTEYVDDWNTDVETRTVYRYALVEYGDHVYKDGKCTLCGHECEHNFSEGSCTECRLPCAHVWKDGICTICSLKCVHSWKNGTCSVCKTVCDHQYENGVCTICSYGCSHSWEDGKCTVCGAVCGHDFKNGSCTICSEPCEHQWRDGECSVCSAVCKHSWEDGKCTVCSKECTHTFVNGICSTCLYRCEHNFVDSKCEYCSMNCTHSFSGGVCSLCNKVCEHGWRDGVCSICNTICDHQWADGKCTICSKVCAHTFEGDTCTNCGTVCGHEYVNGRCDICGTVCKNHNYVDSVCTICNKACTHAYIDGVCNICKAVCEHSFANGVCTDCDLICTHDWYHGVCLDCKTACEHKWEEGECTICDLNCNHNFVDSECTSCGKVCEDHIYVDGICSICQKSEPAYYLFGFINGADYGMNDDRDNIGEYKFTDGKLVATFTTDCYVAVKTGDNSKWYMTSGYQGDNVSLAILYNTDLIANGDRLFVPRGREITFTLTDNGNETLILSYTAAPCVHTSHDTDANCSLCGAKVSHTFRNASCTVCGVACDHSWKSGKCTVCAYKCTHSFENSVCTECGESCMHSFSEGVCVHCSAQCDHIYSGGKCHICGIECKHSFSGNRCTICLMRCAHSFIDGECQYCSLPCEHQWKDGVCSVCDAKCSHSYTDSGVCDTCGLVCTHSFEGFECTECGATRYYLIGNINSSVVGYDGDYKNTGSYGFEDGSVTVTFKYDSFIAVKSCDNKDWYMVKEGTKLPATMYNTKNGQVSDMIWIPAGVKVKLMLTEGENDTLILTCEVLSCAHTSHKADGSCVACGAAVTHTYHKGICSVCGISKPQKDMYLFGVINGKDYGCDGDFANTGIYKFTDGKLTVKFDQPSYVAVKTADNSDWYMTDGAVTEGTTSAVLYNTTLGMDADMMYVPATVEVVFTLVNNGDDTFTLSYEVKTAPQPVIKTKYVTLEYENALRYLAGFSVSNMDGVSYSDMGLAIFTSADPQGTVDSATKLVPGATQDGKNLVVATDYIHPMYMGDTMYFKVYARLSDGSYVYSDILSYSALKYATTVLSNKNASDESKGLVVAMLNYGAEMQKYFGYKTDKLVNAGLSSKQKNYAKEYSDDMVINSRTPDIAKMGEFAPTGGSDIFYPVALLDDSYLAFNCHLITKAEPDSTPTIYLWTNADYARCDVLTKDNASGHAGMSKDSDGNYVVELSQITMQELDETAYFAVVYTKDGETCSTGVIAYTMGELFAANANNNTSDIKALSKAGVVYGYYISLLAK